MSDLQNIEKVLADYTAANRALNAALKENGKKCIEELFTKIFNEHEGLNLVIIQGSTPSFNDGDVCSHSQNTLVGKVGWGKYFDYEDHSYEEEFEHEEDDGVKTNINSRCGTLKQAYEQITNFDEIIARVFDTNFLITASRNKDGSVSVDVDDYECGY